MLSDGLQPQEETAVEEHFRYLQNLTGQGVVFLAGRTLTTDADAFGIVIFQAESEACAREIMERDPVVKQGVMQAVLFPFRIALLGRSEILPT
jgi:uncharacterized protein YciI